MWIGAAMMSKGDIDASKMTAAFAQNQIKIRFTSTFPQTNQLKRPPADCFHAH